MFLVGDSVGALLQTGLYYVILKKEMPKENCMLGVTRQHPQQLPRPSTGLFKRKRKTSMWLWQQPFSPCPIQYSEMVSDLQLVDKPLSHI